MKIVIALLNTFLAFSSALPQEGLEHKSADFAATTTDKKTFSLGLERNQLSQKVLEGNPENLDPDDFYPIWKSDSFSSFGYRLPHALVMVCWFKDKEKSGVFYFEGYSNNEARELVEGFEFNFKDEGRLDSPLMYDGLIKWETLDKAFPLLREAFKSNPRATP